MKHLLIILSILLLSSPLIGQSERPETIIVPVSGIGDVSNTRKLILENTLTDELKKHFRIVPQEKYKQVLEQVFEELEYEECNEDTCIMRVQEILQVENVFNLQIIGEGKDSQLNLKWITLDEKKNETDICMGCGTFQLNDKVKGLIEKLVGETVANNSEVVDISKKSISFFNNRNKKLSGYIEDIPRGWGIGNYGEYEGGEKDNIPNGWGIAIYPNGSKYEGQFKNGLRDVYGTFNFQDGRKYKGEVKEGMINGQGTMTWKDGSSFVGEYRVGRRFNGKEYNSSGKLTHNIVKGVWTSAEERKKQKKLAAASQKQEAFVACGKVHLGDFDWDSANVHTAIASFILEKGYGCQVEVTKGSTMPIMTALFDQQIDIVTEVWRYNLVQLIEDNLAKGFIVELGINTPAAGQGFYVDKLTSDKYGLKHVNDMKSSKIASLFADPESPGKGRMTSCISGWTCHTINLVKQKVYGLEKYYTNFDPGSGYALDSAITDGVKKGEPVFSYYWEPTGLMGRVDLVKLKEPAYNQRCWDEMTTVVWDIKKNGPEVYKPTCACAYTDMVLTKAASTSFASKPAKKPIIDFIKAYTIPTALLNSTLAFYMYESGGDFEETAKFFLWSYKIWENWVPANVAEKVKSALL